MRGALLLNFDEFVKDFGVDYIEVSVNGSIRRIRYQDTNKLYTTPINLNDVVSLSIYTSPTDLDKQISITRKDYTIDAEDGDNGIRDTFITSSSGNSNPLTVTFTGTTTSDAYGFRYTIENYTDGCFPNNNVAFNEQVYDSEIQPDGKILCSGVFTQYSGTNVNNICRLNTDGTLDTTVDTAICQFVTSINGQAQFPLNDFRIAIPPGSSVSIAIKSSANLSRVSCALVFSED